MDLRVWPCAGGQRVDVDTARIDAAGAIAFKDRLRQVTDGGSGRVVLAMGSVGFVDSSGLGAIVAAMKALAPRPLDLAALTPAVDRVFRLTRMDSVFRILDAPPERLTDASQPADQVPADAFATKSADGGTLAADPVPAGLPPAS